MMHENNTKENEKINSFPTRALKDWFRDYGRELPWREDPTPYKVWISEIMLQQTQVSVVIPYFGRWMETFPTIKSLAEAPLEKVLKMWEGLGYYSRARNIHASARFLLENHEGTLPNDPTLLSKLRGLGPYTCGAILSFAFHQKAAALDGNVMRVLSRFFAIEDEIDKSAIQKLLWQYARAILPEEEPWLITEGLIELGALVCTKEPSCFSCPLKSSCLAFRNGLQKELPKKSPRVKTEYLVRLAGVIFYEDWFLVQKREKGEIMADLYEFPYLDFEQSEELIDKRFEKALGLPLRFISKLEEEKHSFTRFRVKLIPYLMEASHKDERYFWQKKETLCELPFSSGHRKVAVKIK